MCHAWAGVQGRVWSLWSYGMSYGLSLLVCACVMCSDRNFLCIPMAHVPGNTAHPKNTGASEFSVLFQVQPAVSYAAPPLSPFVWSVCGQTWFILPDSGVVLLGGLLGVGFMAWERVAVRAWSCGSPTSSNQQVPAKSPTNPPRPGSPSSHQRPPFVMRSGQQVQASPSVLLWSGGMVSGWRWLVSAQPSPSRPVPSVRPGCPAPPGPSPTYSLHPLLCPGPLSTWLPGPGVCVESSCRAGGSWSVWLAHLAYGPAYGLA